MDGRMDSWMSLMDDDGWVDGMGWDVWMDRLFGPAGGVCFFVWINEG